MPIPIGELISQPAAPLARVELAAVYNQLYSLLLLAEADDYPGLGDWVPRTLEAMSPEERLQNRVVMIGLHHTVIPDESLPDFPSYLDYLSRADPRVLRDRMLNIYTESPSTRASKLGPWRDWPEASRQAMLASPENYLGFLSEDYDGACATAIDLEIEMRAYAYVVDPPSMHDLLVTHMRRMWDRFLRDEWVRVRPMLEESVRAFRQVKLDGLSRLEAVRSVTGRDEIDASWLAKIEAARQVVFVPNAHIGPYLGKFRAGDRLHVFFGARSPHGLPSESAGLSRAELLVRLNALADDNRLRILRSIAEHGELCAQEIMRHLGLSQPAASRHLTQLAATGFLTEQRRDGGKCYAINHERFQDTVQALEAYVQVAEQIH